MTDSPGADPYRVLARKYRPVSFAGLIGQDAMVRTLTNAIAADRLAHAFILTGVRGVGKTTTARIIARALNCVGADGKGGPTAAPCGECEHCVAIGEDRHVDVLEMDAASRTGVDDVRELIDGVVYRPVTARYKIYIIDEVHMLSRNAFNALLKTLEEPPEHVKFIFATTEIRKVPVTVLSRCQRFDLRRVDAAALTAHFAAIAEREEAAIADAALRLIARAADGSVRDGLSLLDQAIAHCGAGADEITEAVVRDMLGLADGGLIFDLFDALMKGEIGAALEIVDGLYDSGADPLVVLQDLLELCHWLTRLKVAPGDGDSAAASETERVRGREMAGALSMPVLARAWQMLLKGLGETRTAPSAVQSLEMVLVRLAYAAELPSPADMVRSLKGGGEPAPVAAAAANGSEPARAAAPSEARAAAPESFEDVVALFAERKEALLHSHLTGDVHLVSFAPGHIEFRPGENAPADLARQVGRLLREWTGEQWIVSAEGDGAPAPTLHAQKQAAEDARRKAAIDHPLVQAALESFPGATVESVRGRDDGAVFDGDPIDPETDPSEGDEPP